MTPSWTVLTLLKESVHYLSQKGISNPRLDGEVLLAHALGCRRIDLYLRHDQPLNSDELGCFREMIRRRSRREPVAYIIGTKEFWSLSLRVTPAVLIPRPETELLVEVALDVIRSFSPNPSEPLSLLEIGTGCGAVSIALAVEEGEEIDLVATDRSHEALAVARQNATDLGVDGHIHFLEGDLFEPISAISKPFSMILSNPPYVPTPQLPGLASEISQHEPLEALDGGPDGLGIIRRMLRQAPRFLRGGGVLILEVGDGQRSLVDQELDGSPLWRFWRWHVDLQGRDRVFLAEAAPLREAQLVTGESRHG